MEDEEQGGRTSTFLLCCVLYRRREYPSFYCTLIYYSETGDKASDSVSVCPWLPRPARHHLSPPLPHHPPSPPPACCPRPRLPLAVLRHVDGAPGRHWRASVCDAEHLHGLPLGSPLAVAVQHGRVHALLWWICSKQRKQTQVLDVVGQIVSFQISNRCPDLSTEDYWCHPAKVEPTTQWF